MVGRLLRREGEDLATGDVEREASEIDLLAKQLREAPRQLALELRALASGQGAQVLLFVDQAEELFTLVDDSDTRARFMRAVCTAADDALEPVRVVLTVRDDFLGRLVTGPEVRAALRDMTVIQPLDATSLEEVLRRPVNTVGYRYEEPELVSEMIDAVKSWSARPAGT